MTASPLKLSKRAGALLKRVQAGRFYVWGDERTPKAMQELEAAGLVASVGRPIVIARCYVPATGYTPYQPEEFSIEPPRAEGG